MGRDKLKREDFYVRLREWADLKFPEPFKFLLTFQ